MNTRESKTEYCRRRKRCIVKRFCLKNLDILARFTVPSRLRVILYKIMGINIGRNVFIGLDCMLDSSFPELISIEENVVISFRVMIICHDDAKGLSGTESGKEDMSVSSVTLKKGCYIGAGAIILPGVVVGENAVVGAGAVVTKDVLAETIIAGVPAKKIG